MTVLEVSSRDGERLSKGTLNTKELAFLRGHVEGMDELLEEAQRRADAEQDQVLKDIAINDSVEHFFNDTATAAEMLVPELVATIQLAVRNELDSFRKVLVADVTEAIRRDQGVVAL